MVKPTFDLYTRKKKKNKEKEQDKRVLPATVQHESTVLKRRCQFNINLADILCKCCGLSNSK